MSADSPAAPYEALESVIRRELELVVARDFAGIAALKRERGAIVKRLAPAPPPQARAALERCRALEHEIALELQRARETILRDLERVRRARRTAAGYAPARPATPRISASA